MSYRYTIAGQDSTSYFIRSVVNFFSRSGISLVILGGTKSERKAYREQERLRHQRLIVQEEAAAKKIGNSSSIGIGNKKGSEEFPKRLRRPEKQGQIPQILPAPAAATTPSVPPALPPVKVNSNYTKRE